MEQVIIGILGGDLDASSLLILFILGILTKRFVPWWVHEEVVEKLDEYEAVAPNLLEQLGTLLEFIEEDDELEISEKDYRELRKQREELRHAIKRKTTTVPRKRIRTR